MKPGYKAPVVIKVLFVHNILVLCIAETNLTGIFYDSDDVFNVIKK